MTNDPHGAHGEGASNISRRLFLMRSAVGTVFTGGGLAVGTAVSAQDRPVTPSLIDAYNEFLELERRSLMVELYGKDSFAEAMRYTPCNTGIGGFHEPGWGGRRDGVNDYGPTHGPSHRAALVMSAAGVDLSRIREW